MSKKTEALKLALEALHPYAQWDETVEGDPIPVNVEADAIVAGNKALADQPAQQQDGETITQTFTGLPKRKLDELLAAGWQINGVCFQRTEEDGTVRRGAATTGGMVLWWNQPAQREPVAWPEHEFIQWGAKKYGPLLKAAIDLLAEVENNLDTKDAPQKFGVPFGKLVALRAAIEASPPASRPWVGLTDDDLEKAMEGCIDKWDIAEAIEAKLKEKNA